MNFDFEYATTKATETAGGIGIDWKIIGIIIAIVIGMAIVIMFCLWLNYVVKEKSRKLVGLGTVFCNRCFNEYDASLSKCQYCGNKRIRRDKYVSY